MTCEQCSDPLQALGASSQQSLQRTLATPILTELRLALPEIAKELDCNIADLAISDQIFVYLYESSDHSQDVPYKASGHGELPFISRRGLHEHPQPGVGVLYYRNKLDKSLRYAIYAQQGSYGDVRFLVARKGEIFRLARNANRQRKRAVAHLVEPVLAPGILTAAIEGTVGFIHKGDEISKYGVRVRHGLLLTGPPGNGKTLLCRHIQKLADRHSWGWGVVSASEIDRAYSDGSLTSLFTRYPFSFYDDIDVSYLHREKGKGAVACAILSAMDGVVDIESHYMVRVFTTNESVKGMDPAFARPGRIDQVIELGKPDREMRARLVATWHDEIVENLDIDYFLDATEDMSFADIEGIKTHMVTARVVRGDEWDMEGAINEFAERRAEAETFKTHGFEPGRKPVKKKKKAGDPAYDLNKLQRLVGTDDAVRFSSDPSQGGVP